MRDVEPLAGQSVGGPGLFPIQHDAREIAGIQFLDAATGLAAALVSTPSRSFQVGAASGISSNDTSSSRQLPMSPNTGAKEIRFTIRELAVVFVGQSEIETDDVRG